MCWEKKSHSLFLFNIMEIAFDSQWTPKGPSGVNQEAILLFVPPDELPVN